ncbi:hypothetical protein L1987_17564 [Smallanthus sonchifolius]|uniref:Uncharacterized protein n=1 Tax=Smallanthus sonchifolius TaxID=185202 RepID=A0ACB9IZG7_9ASTR|nr:hypothetical protein L1987_17564 [Smallanthus sonchifolius]
MDLQMSEKRKRGASTCKKKRSSSDQFGIKFNANGIAIGENAADFMSWVGAEFKNRVPINKVAKDVDSKLYDRIWEYAKETWKISDDHTKHTTLRKGKAKSQKARMSAAKNIDPTRIGRWGYSGLETVFESRWNQLVKSYPELDVVQDDGSKMYFVSRARLNPVTNLYELGPNPQSTGFKTNKKQSRAGESTTATSPRICGSIRVSGSSCNNLTDIESVEKCDLLWPYDPPTPLVLGKGLVHFTTERTLHGRSMKDGFVKVQVDRVEEGCTQMPLLPESCIPGEILNTESLRHSVSVPDYRSHKTVEPSRDSSSTDYRPELADDHFSQNRTEPVQFYQHTELVNVYDQHTESIHDMYKRTSAQCSSSSKVGQTDDNVNFSDTDSAYKNAADRRKIRKLHLDSRKSNNILKTSATKNTLSSSNNSIPTGYGNENVTPHASFTNEETCFSAIHANINRTTPLNAIQISVSNSIYNHTTPLSNTGRLSISSNHLTPSNTSILPQMSSLTKLSKVKSKLLSNARIISPVPMVELTSYEVDVQDNVKNPFIGVSKVPKNSSTSADELLDVQIIQDLKVILLNYFLNITQFNNLFFIITTLSLSDHQIQNPTLCEIEKYLLRNNSSLQRFSSMPYPNHDSVSSLNNRLVSEELSYDITNLGNELNKLIDSLTNEQRFAFDEIMRAVEDNRGGVYFVYGYGGTGKSFLWKTLSSAIRCKGEIVLSVASSGIVSLLLSGGRTAHSRFHIPLNLNEDSLCHIKPGSDVANLLKETKLNIWDEAPMVHKHAFEALDRTMKDIFSSDTSMNSEIPFGGKVIVFGGDFRQILLVVPNGSRQEIVNASLVSSYIWSKCKMLTLTKNMRLTVGSQTSNIEQTNNFVKWLLDLGEGNVGDTNDGEATIDIPEYLVINDSADPISSLMDFVYPSILHHFKDSKFFRERAILSPKNEVVHEINDRFLSLFPGEEKEYLSSDSICQTESSKDLLQENLYSPDVLNGFKISGLPNHRFVLKVGVPVILLRNIDQQNGLCNGTRLQVISLGNRVIEAEIIYGGKIGTCTFIPRINLIPSDKKIPFKFQRRQFPLFVCFAMTINKSQGQSLSRVGLYLKHPVFTHGQLYVALLRVKTRNRVKLPILDKDGKATKQTTNVVYKEIFRNL